MKRIAVDMDEVMADTLTHQINWLGAAHGHKVNRADLAGKKLQHVADGNYHAALETYMHTGVFFADIPVHEGAHDALQKLSEKYEIYVTTAAMDYPRSCQAKFEWLQRHFSFIAKDCYVFCGNKSIVRADYLIDDNPWQLSNFAGTPILFHAPHNIHEKRFKRVLSWDEVLAYFLDPALK